MDRGKKIAFVSAIFSYAILWSIAASNMSVFLKYLTAILVCINMCNVYFVYAELDKAIVGDEG